METSLLKRPATRIIYFDILNIICCICVVALHMKANSWSYENSSAWKQALGVEVLCYFAVPVFFMLCGATLLNYRSRYSTKEFFKKRFVRIIIPYVFWSLFFLAFYWVKGDIQIHSVGDLIFQIIQSITGYSSQGIFWFMQAVINIYLCMPVLSLLADKKHEKLRWYVIIVGIISNMIFPLINKLIGLSFGSYSGFFIMDGVLVYVLLGYQLTMCRMKKWHVVLIGLLACLALAIKYITTIILSNAAGKLVADFYGYVTLWALIPACAVFLIIQMISWDKIVNTPRKSRFLQKISSCSYGVYLIHLPVIIVF